MPPDINPFAAVVAAAPPSRTIAELRRDVHRAAGRLDVDHLRADLRDARDALPYLLADLAELVILELPRSDAMDHFNRFAGNALSSGHSPSNEVRNLALELCNVADGCFAPALTSIVNFLRNAQVSMDLTTSDEIDDFVDAAVAFAYALRFASPDGVHDAFLNLWSFIKIGR